LSPSSFYLLSTPTASIQQPAFNMFPASRRALYGPTLIASFEIGHGISPHRGGIPGAWYSQKFSAARQTPPVHSQSPWASMLSDAAGVTDSIGEQATVHSATASMSGPSQAARSPRSL
jgi:hypothetical protein